MTKAEIIARYGQEEYDRRAGLNRVYARETYCSLSPGERSQVYQERRAYVDSWVEKNPERAKAMHRRHALKVYHALSPAEKRALYEKRKAARDAKRAADATFNAAHLAGEKQRMDKYRAAHPELTRERTRAYEKAYPEKKRANKHARRAAGRIDPEFIKFLKRQSCADCGTTEKRRQVGHLIPVSKGGTNHVCNLIAQCQSCNGKQHNKIHPRAMMAHYPEAARFAA